MNSKPRSILMLAGLLALVLAIGSVMAGTSPETGSAHTASEAMSVFVAARG